MNFLNYETIENDNTLIIESKIGIYYRNYKIDDIVFKTTYMKRNGKDFYEQKNDKLYKKIKKISNSYGIKQKNFVPSYIICIVDKKMVLLIQKINCTDRKILVYNREKNIKKILNT